jgi:hypothetical protein
MSNTDDLIKHTEIKFLTTNSFDSIIRLRQETNAQLKELTATLKGLNTEILEMMELAEIKAVAVGELAVKVIGSSNSRIDKQKLLEYGVDAFIISESTVVREYSYLKVS